MSKLNGEFDMRTNDNTINKIKDKNNTHENKQNKQRSGELF